MKDLWSLLELVKRLRPNGRGLLSTIRARLYFAFGCAALLTTIGSAISFYEFTTVGAATNEVLSRTFPATAASLRLAEESSSLVSSAPRLMTAIDTETSDKISKSIRQQAATLKEHIDRLRELGIANVNEIDLSRKSLVQRLDTLNQAVKVRLAVLSERNYLTSSIRDTHESMLDALVPAIDDANFDLVMKSRMGTYDPMLGPAVDTLRRLFEIESESNLLAGLLMEASLVTDASQLEPLRDQVGAAKRKIENNLGKIPQASLKKKLVSLYRSLSSIGSDDGIIQIRAFELERQHDAEAAFVAAQSEAVKLKNSVDILVAEQSESAHKNSLSATRRIWAGETFLVVIAVAALAGAALIAWLYVGRNIARRLGLLSSAMRRMADGDLGVQVGADGNDEIAEMAQALQFFRQAIADVVAARQKEIDQTRTLEIRRQLVETATKSFENAVSKVVQTLDRAASVMDSTARDMAANAARNQEQAVAAAAATGQATTNVEAVAASAEEIARSIEHIAARIAESASVASAASSEAEAITGAVEGLSESVDEISQVSGLIRNIAAQTNLLALNATIEAARAGEAGRGFAVVAQEVKTLATQAGKATEEITRQIKSIEGTSSRSVQGMRSIVATISKLNNLAGDVAMAMGQQDAVTQEIARNAVAAASGTRHVSKNVSEVSDTATKTGQVAKTVLDAARELADQSNLLRQEVEHYLDKVRAS